MADGRMRSFCCAKPAGRCSQRIWPFRALLVTSDVAMNSMVLDEKNRYEQKTAGMIRSTQAVKS